MIGRNCPILAQLLRQSHNQVTVPSDQGLQMEPDGVELPLRRADPAPLIHEDPSLWFALQSATLEPPPSTEQTPGFTHGWGAIRR